MRIRRGEGQRVYCEPLRGGYPAGSFAAIDGNDGPRGELLRWATDQPSPDTTSQRDQPQPNTRRHYHQEGAAPEGAARVIIWSLDLS